LDFEIDCDGIFGSGTEKVVKLAQEDLLVKSIDGIVGNITYKAIIEASKLVTKNYKEKIIWLNPKDLKGALVKSSSSTLSKKYKNFINAAFFWNNPSVGDCICGWFYSEGKSLKSIDVNRKYSYGTLIVLRNGSVICKQMSDVEIRAIKKDIWFCVQGFIEPKSEGYNVQEIGRECIRPIICFNSKTGKVLIAMYKGDYKTCELVAKKYGCDKFIGIDGGGSSNMYLDGKYVYKTSRVLNNIIFWNE